jgi:hypothetical protein
LLLVDQGGTQAQDFDGAQNQADFSLRIPALQVQDPKDTILNNPDQLGAAIRLRRKEKGLTQSELAKFLGAERKWWRTL